MSRRFQFSLRTLLVAMLIVAAFFGGTAVQRRIEANRRADAYYDYDADDMLIITAETGRNHRRVLINDGGGRFSVVAPQPRASRTTDGGASATHP